jgi:hypothetical protein
MTLTLEITADLEEALRESAEREGLPPDRYILNLLQQQLKRNRAMPPRLSREQSLLLQQINQGLPAETWERYHHLVAKRRAETLTPEEHQELIGLTNDVELWHARRLELVAELARLRNVPFPQMMDELGLTQPPYA